MTVEELMNKLDEWTKKLNARASDIPIREREYAALAGDMHKPEIDEGIKGLLVRLWELGYDTDNSCEGIFYDPESGMTDKDATSTPYLSMRWRKLNQATWQQAVRAMAAYDEVLYNYFHSSASIVNPHEPHGKITIETSHDGVDMITPILDEVYIQIVPYEKNIWTEGYELRVVFYLWANKKDEAQFFYSHPEPPPPYF